MPSSFRDLLSRARETQREIAPAEVKHRLDSGERILISRSAAGQIANRPAEAAVASRDLSRIVFESEADNLVLGDTNNARDLFVFDRKVGTITRVEARR